MIILCAGGHRSGSTWQYNAVRILARIARGASYGAWIAQYDPSRSEPVHVVKVHEPAEAQGLEAAAIVTCFRDLRTMFASLERMKWTKGKSLAYVATSIDRYIDTLSYWRERAVHTMRYEDMIANPLAELKATSEALHLNLSCEQLELALQELDRLRPPAGKPKGVFTEFDPQSLLHRGHIGHSQLAAKTARFIEKNYASWLRQNGYAVGEPGPAPALPEVPVREYDKQDDT